MSSEVIILNVLKRSITERSKRKSR